MSSDLSWSHHIANITSKAYKILGLLRRTFSPSIDITTKKRLYISLVRSQLLYGSQIWRPLHLKDINPIESVQRRATKYILNDYISDYRSRLVKLNLLPLTMLLEFNDICFFIQSIKHISPSNSFNIALNTSHSASTTLDQEVSESSMSSHSSNIIEINSSTLIGYHTYGTLSHQST